MDKQNVLQWLTQLRGMKGLPSSIIEKTDALEQRLNLVSNDQFTSWTDGVVHSDAQKEDRHWGFRSEIQELHSEISSYVNNNKAQIYNLDEVSRVLNELGNAIEASKPR